MWKFINSIILIIAVLFGIVQSYVFGNLMYLPWQIGHFVAAPFIFFAMVVAPNYIRKHWFNASHWATPSFNSNLFKDGNPLNMPFCVGGMFMALGIGIGAADLFLGRSLTSVSIMIECASFGLLLAGYFSVKLFSDKKRPMQ